MSRLAQTTDGFEPAEDFLNPLADTLADQVATVIFSLLKPHEKKVQTLTSENGKEFAQRKNITENLKADSIFQNTVTSERSQTRRFNSPWTD